MGVLIKVVPIHTPMDQKHKSDVNFLHHISPSVTYDYTYSRLLNMWLGLINVDLNDKKHSYYYIKNKTIHRFQNKPKTAITEFTMFI